MLLYLRDNRFLSPVILLGVVIALGILMPSNFGYRVATLVWTSALAAIGLNLLMGYAGQVSLGHAGFFGIGAYAVAVLPGRFSLNSWLSLIVGGVASGVLAYVVGTPILRLKGYYLAIATLGLGILIAMVLNNEGWLTGGPDGIQVPRPTDFRLARARSRNLVLDQRRSDRHRRMAGGQYPCQFDRPSNASLAGFRNSGACRGR